VVAFVPVSNMYELFFGVQQAPFKLTPDPKFLYLTPQYQEALAGLAYAILARKGFVVLTGNAGTGKTTVVRRIMHSLPAERVQSSVILHPTLSPAEFLEATLLDFGFKRIPASKPKRIAALQSFLWRGHEQGRISALIVDEAHKLSFEVLEEIRLLGNFESPDEKLLQVALVGQSELSDVLDNQCLRHLKQRIALRLSIDPLSAADTQHYIAYRWRKAGGNTAPFTAESMVHISLTSQGVPRVINVICDNALTRAFSEGSALVEVRHVRGACQDLHLPPPASPKPLAAEQLAPLAPVELCSLMTPERHPVSAAAPSVLAWLRTKLRIVQRLGTA
jgi:general secretion pathway protein A